METKIYPFQHFPGIPTTIKTMGVNITTTVYLRVLIIQIGSTIILMVVEAQGFRILKIESEKGDFSNRVILLGVLVGLHT